MSLRSLPTLQIFWLVEHGCPFFADGMSRLGKQKKISLYPDKSVHFWGGFNDGLHCLLLSHITRAVAEASCHSSTPCQHFTDPYEQRGAKGGRGRNACRRQRKGRGEGEGCSRMKASAMMLHRGKRRCQNERDSHLVKDVFRLLHG